MSVSELNRAVRGTLERGFPSVRVRGEISNFVRAASGHLYFVVKDGGAQVRCAMWRARASTLAWQPRDGDAVEVRAAVTLFEARGDYQLNVDSLARAGVGALFEAFLLLKDKLAREGLFDPARKRAPVRLPRAVGVVTSLKAAALRDVLTTLERRAPMVRVVVYPAPVQGGDAAAALIAALGEANRRAEVDTLILCRGGGSIEDLWAFNDEALARAIVGSGIPVVSGVGHETDFTIADFAADVRAPTPTAAAELVAPPRPELLAELAAHARALVRVVETRMAGARQRLDWIARDLVPPSQRLTERRHLLQMSGTRLAAAMAGAVAGARQSLLPWMNALRPPPVEPARGRLGQATRRLARAGAQSLARQGEELARLEATLAHLDPHAVLERGYAVVRDARGKAVHDAALLGAGDGLDITFARGGVKARVE